VGNEVDLCIEIHRRLSPAEAIVLARGIEPTTLLLRGSHLARQFRCHGSVAENIHIPIATGERRAHHLRVRDCCCAGGGAIRSALDVCLAGVDAQQKDRRAGRGAPCGGVPHNPLSPVSTALCIQLAACIPKLCAAGSTPSERHSRPRARSCRVPSSFEKRLSDASPMPTAWGWSCSRMPRSAIPTSPGVCTRGSTWTARWSTSRPVSQEVAP